MRPQLGEQEPLLAPLDNVLQDTPVVESSRSPQVTTREGLDSQKTSAKGTYWLYVPLRRKTSHTPRIFHLRLHRRPRPWHLASWLYSADTAQPPFAQKGLAHHASTYEAEGS